MVAKLLELYKSKKIKYTNAILIYIFADIALYIFGVLTADANIVIGILAAIATFLGYSLLIEIKVSYPQCFEIVNLWIYVLLLGIFPLAGILLLENTVVSEDVAQSINLDGLMYLIAKLLLYIRAYILAKRYNLDEMV